MAKKPKISLFFQVNRPQQKAVKGVVMCDVIARNIMEKTANLKFPMGNCDV